MGWARSDSCRTRLQNGATPSSQFTGMLYDGVGNRTQVNALIPALSGSTRQTAYQFDTQDELIHEQTDQAPVYSYAFQYDPSGNPNIIRNSPWITYDQNDQVSGDARFQYDGNGNPLVYPWQTQTATLAYDPENHLSQVLPPAGPNNPSIVTYGYNGDGLRAWKQVGTNASSCVYYLYDGSVPVAEFNSDGTALLASNVFGANGLLSRRVGSTSTFYTFDPQGNVCQRFNLAGTVLSADSYDAQQPGRRVRLRGAVRLSHRAGHRALAAH